MRGDAEVSARYDEEEDVCVGCGRHYESDEHDWCPNCAPEVHRP